MATSNLPSDGFQDTSRIRKAKRLFFWSFLTWKTTKRKDALISFLVLLIGLSKLE